jgi:hypothetical protein
MVETLALRIIRRFHRAATILLVIVVAITVSFLISRPKAAQTERAASHRTHEAGWFASIDTEWVHRDFTALTAAVVAGAPAKRPTPAVVSSTTVVAPASGPVVGTVRAVVTEPSVAELVAEVEATGIDPGSNWTWSMGNTATHCGLITGPGTGCTYGSGGLEFTIFSGSPTLALVAHELANAETQNDAVPSLLSEVSLAAAGSSWSPTDAVASCLVVHFMGFQDDAAGSWQCTAALATVVADNIHDTL